MARVPGAPTAPTMLPFDAALIARNCPAGASACNGGAEEFDFGDGPAMLVTLHVDLDSASRPADWTSGVLRAPTHVQQHAVAAAALFRPLGAIPDPPARSPAPTDPPEARGGGGTRNAGAAHDVPAHGVLHHLVLPPPVHHTLGPAG